MRYCETNWDLAEDSHREEIAKVDEIIRLLEDAQKLCDDLIEGGDDLKAGLDDEIVNLRHAIPTTEDFYQQRLTRKRVAA